MIESLKEVMKYNCSGEIALYNPCDPTLMNNKLQSPEHIIALKLEKITSCTGKRKGNLENNEIDY